MLSEKQSSANALPLSSIAYLIGRYFTSLNVSVDKLLRLSFRALHQHELFHFATDYASSQAELLSRRPCYRPSRSLKDPKWEYNLLEEQLANVNMIHSFWGQPLKGKTRVLRSFISEQPPGYHTANWRSSYKCFLNDRATLMHDYLNCMGGFYQYTSKSLDTSNLYPNFPIDWRYCPIHLINDGQRFCIDAQYLSLIRQILIIHENKQFLKKLHRTPKQIQISWEKAKNRLSQSTAGAGLDFKFWERTSNGSVYSLRLSRNYRVHLLLTGGTGQDLALDIGSHKAMGHG